MEETETEGNSNNGYLGYLQVMAHESRPSRCMKASDIAQKGKGARPRATDIFKHYLF